MVLPMTEKRLLADALIADSVVELQKNMEQGGKRDQAWTGEVDGLEDESVASGVVRNAVS